jgi:hypothetical protein
MENFVDADIIMFSDFEVLKLIFSGGNSEKNLFNKIKSKRHLLQNFMFLVLIKFDFFKNFFGFFFGLVVHKTDKQGITEIKRPLRHSIQEI